MANLKRMILTTVLVAGALSILGNSEAEAGRRAFRGFRNTGVNVAFHRYRRPVFCYYYVYKWHCGCWRVAGKYASYSAAKYRAHQLACRGYRFNIKKVIR